MPQTVCCAKEVLRHENLLSNQLDSSKLTGLFTRSVAWITRSHFSLHRTNIAYVRWWWCYMSVNKMYCWQCNDNKINSDTTSGLTPWAAPQEASELYMSRLWHATLSCIVPGNSDISSVALTWSDVHHTIQHPSKFVCYDRNCQSLVLLSQSMQRL